MTRSARRSALPPFPALPSPSSQGWRSALSRLPRTPSPWCPAYCDLFPVGYTFEEEKTEAVVEPQNFETTGQPLLEESAHRGEGEPALSTSQEMVPIESVPHKSGENVEIAESSQNTAFSRSNLE